MRSLRSDSNAIRAFTLIELLVVVAIVAILSAIAVPNFLEAQTRSKVSRAKSDLRILAGAIEAYTVDYSVPPFDGMPGTIHYGYVNALSELTTPVGFLSGVLPDVFPDRTLEETLRTGHTDFVTPGHASFDYSSATWEDLANRPEIAGQWKRRVGNSRWKICSAGPDLRFINEGSYFGLLESYDPTNGTTSMGDILRSQQAMP